jgi:hypothetical protein
MKNTDLFLAIFRIGGSLTPLFLRKPIVPRAELLRPANALFS